MPEWLCTLNWRDNNGRKAETRLWYSGGLSLAAVSARAIFVAGLMLELSDAELYGVELSKRYFIADPPAPLPGSDTRARLLLFYGNDTGAATLSVPSPGALPLDLVGPYRNVRLVLDAPSLSPLLAALGSSLASAVTPRGTAWVMPLLTGGVTRYGDE